MTEVHLGSLIVLSLHGTGFERKSRDMGQIYQLENQISKWEIWLY